MLHVRVQFLGRDDTFVVATGLVVYCTCHVVGACLICLMSGEAGCTVTETQMARMLVVTIKGPLHSPPGTTPLTSCCHFRFRLGTSREHAADCRGVVVMVVVFR